jgi:hypothetical protein
VGRRGYAVARTGYAVASGGHNGTARIKHLCGLGAKSLDLEPKWNPENADLSLGDFSSTMPDKLDSERVMNSRFFTLRSRQLLVSSGVRNVVVALASLTCSAQPEASFSITMSGCSSEAAK